MSCREDRITASASHALLPTMAKVGKTHRVKWQRDRLFCLNSPPLTVASIRHSDHFQNAFIDLVRHADRWFVESVGKFIERKNDAHEFS